MLLDTKITYLLSKEISVRKTIYDRLRTNLAIRGKAETNYIITIEASFQLLNTSILTYNLKLEVYKKLIHLLRFFDILINPTDVARQ